MAMVNLIIGICFGIASAVALAVMWRMADRLREEVQSRHDKPASKLSAAPRESHKPVQPRQDDPAD